eukprot:10462147-Alexandrium_andersonii.AAC.1
MSIAGVSQAGDRAELEYALSFGAPIGLSESARADGQRTAAALRRSQETSAAHRSTSAPEHAPVRPQTSPA